MHGILKRLLPEIGESEFDKCTVNSDLRVKFIKMNDVA